MRLSLVRGLSRARETSARAMETRARPSRGRAGGTGGASRVALDRRARRAGARGRARSSSESSESVGGGVAVTRERESGREADKTARAEDARGTGASTEVDARPTASKGAERGVDKELAVVLMTALAVGAEVYARGGVAPAAEDARRALASAATGLVQNHAPGVGGIIEDSFLGLLTVGTVYALWRSSVIPRPIGNPIARKSKTNASWVHVVTGAGGLAMALYAVGLERIYRESPGWTWMWVSSAMFMANALTYGPLMNIFKASKEGKYAMQLGYSFVASFQGVVWIAWSAQPDAPDWMYWAVMPYWYFSLAKLWESTEFVLALTPKPANADGLWAKVTEGSRKRLGKMTPDAATLTYVGLNAAAAVFDNCYMALYTLLGPEQFWHTSQAFNDSDFHLRLVKGTTGSLTVALLIFISTLGWRKQMPMKYAIWLNVVLGSVGPWIVLFWHKLLDPSEDWFPQFVFDPNFAYHAYLNPSMTLFSAAVN